MDLNQEILDLSPFFHFVKDKNGYYLQVNNAYEKTLGLSRNEIIGKKDEQIFPPDIYSVWKDRERRIFREKKNDQFEITVNHEGVDRTFLVFYSPRSGLKEKDDEFSAWILELTDRVRSERNLMTILDSLNSGYLLIDPETRIVHGTNRRALDMIGCLEQQIVGGDCQQFICKVRDGECPIDNQGMRVENMDGLLRVCGGEKIPILKTIIPVMLGRKRFLLESFTDISQQKTKEALLGRTIEELEKFNKFAIDREERMIELKNEVNQLCVEMGRKKRYKVDSEKEQADE